MKMPVPEHMSLSWKTNVTCSPYDTVAGSIGRFFFSVPRLVFALLTWRCSCQEFMSKSTRMHVHMRCARTQLQPKIPSGSPQAPEHRCLVFMNASRALFTSTFMSGKRLECCSSDREGAKANALWPSAVQIFSTVPKAAWALQLPREKSSHLAGASGVPKRLRFSRAHIPSTRTSGGSVTYKKRAPFDLILPGFCDLHCLTTVQEPHGTATAGVHLAEAWAR